MININIYLIIEYYNILKITIFENYLRFNLSLFSTYDINMYKLSLIILNGTIIHFEMEHICTCIYINSIHIFLCIILKNNIFKFYNFSFP